MWAVKFEETTESKSFCAFHLRGSTWGSRAILPPWADICWRRTQETCNQSTSPSAINRQFRWLWTYEPTMSFNIEIRFWFIFLLKKKKKRKIYFELDYEIAWQINFLVGNSQQIFITIYLSFIPHNLPEFCPMLAIFYHELIIYRVQI